MVENIIIWLTLACFAFIFICILSIMDHKEKAKVERIAKEELANGIENRWVVTGFYFCIIISCYDGLMVKVFFQLSKQL